MAADDEQKSVPGENEESAGRMMGFLDHLEELRWTLLWCAIAFLLGAGAVGLFLQQFSGLLQWPMRVAFGADQAGMIQGLTTRSPFEAFSVLFQVVFLGGFVLALPAILYFVARFIAPGLTKKELAILRPGALAAFFLFLTGASFAFFLLVPATLRVSQYLNALLGFEMLWSPASYYGMLLWMTTGVGLLFEFPLIVLVLVAVGIVSPAQLVTFRPYSIVLFLVLAAIITPTPDPVTFLLLAGPMWLLYEGSILIARRIARNRPEAAPQPEEVDWNG